MNLDTKVVDLAREMLLTVLLISGPLLIMGLIIGVTVSVFQALTSVQEQTLSMVPKMMAVTMLALALLGPTISLLSDFFKRIIGQLHEFGLS